MYLTRLAIERPLVLVMAIAALMLLGWRALISMPAELDPRVDIPIVNVTTVYPGAGPEEIERAVSRPLEDAVASVSNVTDVSSRSLENVSFVTCEFKLGTNLDAAAADVRARVDSMLRDLPDEIQPPEVAKFDFNARPVMVLGVTGRQSLQQLRLLVDDTIRPRLGQIGGVGNVSVVGGLQREVQVQVDPDRLAQHGLTLLDLLRPLQAASQSAPAGAYVQGSREVSVRVLGEFTSLEDLRDTPLPPPAPPTLGGSYGMRGRPGPSAPLRLGDVAQIKDTFAAREQITRVGQRESIGLIISRLSDANTVHVAEGVRAALAELGSRLPSDVRITTIQDNSQAVADALEDINATLFLGAILAVLVVWIFLHSLKDTFIVAVAIPISILTTFIVMYFAGFTLNQMTMLALSLSVGILVDQSILVLECIHRHRAMAKGSWQAALDGRREIGLADAANTFVDVVVFIPIAFMAGIVGQFFKQFGLTIATATLASLYVSFTVTPMLAARWFRRGEGVDEPTDTQREPGRRRFAALFDAGYLALERFYRRLLEGALRHRLLVVVGGFGALAVVGFLAWRLVGFDFTPSVDRGQVNVRVELPPGASLAEADALLQRVEAEAARIPEVDAPRMLASAGEIIGGFGSLPDRGSQFAQLTLMLIPKQGLVEKLLHPGGQKGMRNRTDEQVATELRGRLGSLTAKARIAVSAVRGLTASLAPLQIGLHGRDLNELESVAAEIQARMEKVSSLENIDTSVRRGKPELQVVLDRDRAEELFVTPAELAGLLRTAIAGNTDFQYRERDQAYPIRLQVARGALGGDRAGPEALKGILLAQRGPTRVYVADVADVRFGTGPTKIMRSQRLRRVTLYANLKPGVPLGAAQQAVEAAIADVRFGGIEMTWEGEVDDMSESAGHMVNSLLLAIALSYMLMAALFNSLLMPLAIMVSIPMALVGALLGLIYTGTTMNIVSMIGIVMLVGLVSKNAILLVDYTNTLRSRGLTRDAAIQAAGPVRLRPILMTTLATVIAMLPVALQIGRASEMRSPMAIVVIGGLILSTLLTLVVIPVMYTYFDDLGTGMSRAWGRAFPQRGSGEDGTEERVVEEVEVES